MDIPTKLRSIILIFLCYVSLLLPVTGGKTCKKINACSCKTDSGFVVDLSPLSSDDGTPQYVDNPDRDGRAEEYSWNPCTPFTEGTCINVAACLSTAVGSIAQYEDIGDHSSADFIYDNNGRLVIQYQVDSNRTITTNAVLICDKKTTSNLVTYTVSDDAGGSDYYFELTTKYACEPSGLSIGSIILIVFVSVVFVYLVAGILIQIFIRKESGKRSIPNYSFWSTCPVLVKDGACFVVSRGKRTPYDKI